jgi:hypothetical protein
MKKRISIAEYLKYKYLIGKTPQSIVVCPVSLKDKYISFSISFGTDESHIVSVPKSELISHLKPYLLSRCNEERST